MHLLCLCLEFLSPIIALHTRFIAHAQKFLVRGRYGIFFLAHYLKKVCFGMATGTYPSPAASVPESANAALLPGSRSSMIHIWPTPLPLECGVIRLQEKLAASLKQHGTGGQRFPLKVSSVCCMV